MKNNMPNYILQLLLGKEVISDIDLWILAQWKLNATEQEINYYLKVSDAFFAN